MELVDYTPALAADWDAFVNTHPLSSHGHLRAQFSFADASGVRNTSLAVRDGGRLVGLLPLFVLHRRALRRVPIRELVSGAFFPAGPLVSPKLAGKAEARVLDTLLAGARARAATLGADRLIVTHPHVVGGQPSIVRFAYSPLLHWGFRAQSGVGLLLDLSQTPEALAAGRRSGCRQSIAKAQSGASVRMLTDRSDWLACRELNIQTLGELAFSDRQLASIWDDLIVPGHATAHAVCADGTMAAVAVTIHTANSAYYWIGLNRRPAPLPGAGHLALWTAITASQTRGCRYFELGSLDFENTKNIGISQFKQSFGGMPYQIISADLDLKPVKSAAVALGAAVLAAARQWREGQRHHTTSTAPRATAPPATPPQTGRPVDVAVTARS